MKQPNILTKEKIEELKSNMKDNTKWNLHHYITLCCCGSYRMEDVLSILDTKEDMINFLRMADKPSYIYYTKHGSHWINQGSDRIAKWDEIKAEINKLVQLHFGVDWGEQELPAIPKVEPIDYKTLPLEEQIKFLEGQIEETNGRIKRFSSHMKAKGAAAKSYSKVFTGIIGLIKYEFWRELGIREPAFNAVRPFVECATESEKYYDED